MNLKSIKYFAVTFLLIGATPIFYFWTLYQTELNAIQSLRETEAKHQLNYSQNAINEISSELSTSLRLLSDSRALLQFIQSPSLKNRALLESLWSLTATNYSYISQVRFIDTDGMEQSRVDDINGEIKVTPIYQLQDKSQRNYFLYAQTLKAEEVGSFGIDLEVENGKVVVPLQPTLRIFTPVEVADERKGYLVFNLDVYEIIEEIDYSIDSHYNLEFVGPDGYYLASKNKEKMLGNLIEERDSFNLLIENSNLWEAMEDRNIHNFKDKKHFYAFNKIVLGNGFEGSEFYLLLTSNIKLDSSGTDHKLAFILYETIMAIILLIILSVIISRYIVKHRTTSLESQLALAALNGMSSIVITDKNNRIIKVNDEFTRVSGWEESEVMGQCPSIFQSGVHSDVFYAEMWQTIQKKQCWEGEVVNKRKDGTLITEILRIQAIMGKNGKVQYFIASFVDITARKELENCLRELSEKDMLTQCWNRRKFEAEFSKLTNKKRLTPKVKVSCLAIIDIDYFKRINDQYGHDVGDKVIKNVARILQTESRSIDFVARIGGEEFAILLPNTSLKEAEVILNRLRVAIHLADDSLSVTVSGGVTDICDCGEATYKRADLALYESKTAGRNQISCFPSSEMDQIA
ncbi:sensor domain-containing diguanylate cyclase [Aliivibrio fischeri]|uniref:sensor domain-containing diguanylate cyclase n=1 Tax=Aliivibrio fischeri TaxID=668 RepID=UPI0012DA06C7|nr:diguanylate cyclase [Aliivibrio fischeri]MUJ22994.1 diguanylate cyclase [Aliivibrio fischeri]